MEERSTRSEALDDLRVEVPAHLVHDLKTPAATVRASLDTALAHWDKLDEEQRHAFVLLARDSAVRLTQALGHVVPAGDVVELRD